MIHTQIKNNGKMILDTCVAMETICLCGVCVDGRSGSLFGSAGFTVGNEASTSAVNRLFRYTCACTCTQTHAHRLKSFEFTASDDNELVLLKSTCIV